MFKYKPQLLFHHTARFPWHPLFLNLSLPSLQCQECPRSNLSGMCPVCTDLGDPLPLLPGFTQGYPSPWSPTSPLFGLLGWKPASPTSPLLARWGGTSPKVFVG